MQIVPAILEKDIDTFWHQIKRLAPYFSTFQIDIADGKFVPNRTLQIEDIVDRITNYELRIKQKIFDYHLMVEDYETELERLPQLSDSMTVGRILIHAKAFTPNNKLPLTNYQFGLVLNPEDEVGANWDVIARFKVVQIMTVNPGFQGAPFLPEQLEKIDELRGRGFEGKILLDGGINEKTIPQIVSKEYQPDILGIGSYITHAEDLEGRVKELKSLVKDAEF